MNYKGKYSPSDLLDPVSYEWHPLEDFKSRLDETSFVTFDVQTKRDYPPGWLDPKNVKENDLENVFVLIGDGRIAPIECIVKFKTSKSFKKSILDYVCSVGLELAHKMIIC